MYNLITKIVLSLFKLNFLVTCWKFSDKCRKFLVIWKFSNTCTKLPGGGSSLCPDIFRSLKVCYPEEEKMPLYLSGTCLAKQKIAKEVGKAIINICTILLSLTVYLEIYLFPQLQPLFMLHLIFVLQGPLVGVVRTTFHFVVLQGPHISFVRTALLGCRDHPSFVVL